MRAELLMFQTRLIQNRKNIHAVMLARSALPARLGLKAASLKTCLAVVLNGAAFFSGVKDLLLEVRTDTENLR